LSCDQFSAMIGAIYQGPLEPVPWGSALVMLREIMRANWATLILRPASADQPALLMRAGEHQEPEIYAAAYSEYSVFSVDPFVGLPPDRVVTIDEMIDTSWMSGEFYVPRTEQHPLHHGRRYRHRGRRRLPAADHAPARRAGLLGKGQGAVPIAAAAPAARRDSAFADRTHRDGASAVLHHDGSHAGRHGGLRREGFGHAHQRPGRRNSRGE